MSLRLVAAAYALSFLVVCLGTCLAAAPVAEHGCCGGREGVRAAPVDCCSVTPSAAPDGPTAGACASLAIVSSSWPAAVVSPARSPLVLASLASSPPLILRV
jgi:hypothetical protein